MDKELFISTYLSNLACAKDCLAGKKCVEMFNNAICFRPIFDHIKAVEKATGTPLVPNDLIKDRIVYESSDQMIKVTIVDGLSNMEHKSEIPHIL